MLVGLCELNFSGEVSGVSRKRENRPLVCCATPWIGLGLVMVALSFGGVGLGCVGG